MPCKQSCREDGSRCEVKPDLRISVFYGDDETYILTLDRIMIWLPLDKFTLETSLSSLEAAKKIAEQVQPWDTVILGIGGTYKKAYVGHVSKTKFEIQRLIWYRNAFLPKINGEIEGVSDGTKVTFKMRIQGFAILFMGLGFILLGYGVLDLSFRSIKVGAFDSYIFAPLGMLIILYLFMLICYKLEARKSRQFFVRLFSN
jgi:hypothetical protein